MQLNDAVKIVERRWQGMRSEKTSIVALRTVLAYMPPNVEEITQDHIDRAAALCTERGWKPSSIARAMSGLKLVLKAGGNAEAFGFNTGRKTRMDKWWLKPQDMEPLLAHLASRDHGNFADFVEWQCLTGLRVEESLRVLHNDFFGADITEKFDHETRRTVSIDLTVRGTKTAGSQRVIRLKPAAWAIAQRHGQYSRPDGFLWAVSYEQLKRLWALNARPFLKTDDPTCTLKALRRTFARLAIEKGMPAPVLMKYMGHTKLATTELYLQLVGDYATEVQAQWL